MGIRVWMRKTRNERSKDVWMKERKNNIKNKKSQLKNVTTIFSQ